MRRWGSLGLVLLLLWGSTGETQLAVIDAANLAANSTTSFQSTITAIEAVIQTGLAIEELLPVEEIVLAAEFAQTMALLFAILEEAHLLLGDIESIQAQIATLFALETAPNTPLGLEERLGEINQVIFDARSYAMRAQTLLSTLAGAVGHVVRLVEMIGILTGNHSSNAVLIQLTAVVNQQLATQTAMHATWQRQDILKHLGRDLVLASVTRIEAERWRDWPATIGEP